MEVPGVGAESHTASGRVAVSKLKAAIFGGAKTDRGLLDIVVVCTVEKVRMALYQEFWGLGRQAQDFFW